MKISFPIVPLILWLEIDILGKTILPELFCFMVISFYIILNFIVKIFQRSILWRLMLEIKTNGIKMVSI